MKRLKYFALLSSALLLAACNPTSDEPKPEKNEPDTRYVGQAVGNFSADEWFPGGQLGTTTNVTDGCYEDETPAVEMQGLSYEFNLGE